MAGNVSNKVKNKVRNKVKKTIGKSLELPKEVVLDLPLISIIGCEELSIENYKGIVEYSDDCIRLKTSIGIFKIEGKNMVLKQVTNESVLVTGTILKTEYSR